MTMSLLRIILISTLGLHSIQSSYLDQTHSTFGAAGASKNVEDFISAVQGFEQMKHSSQHLEQGATIGSSEKEGKMKGKRKWRRIRRKKPSASRERNENIIRVHENDTVNLNNPKKILLTKQEKRKISQFLSKVCSTTKSRDVAKFCYKRRKHIVQKPPSLLSKLLSFFSN